MMIQKEKKYNIDKMINEFKKFFEENIIMKHFESKAIEENQNK